MGRQAAANRERGRVQETADRLLSDAGSLSAHILRVLGEEDVVFPGGLAGAPDTSAVLVPLESGQGGAVVRPSLILNKRSERVKQPGDLCFPGGRVAPVVDRWLARVLVLPGFPLRRWPCWASWRQTRRRAATRLALLLAASLRESFEEMRLNPLSVAFLGPLPGQHLVMFRRIIYPMVGWVPRQKRLKPNWEVDRVVRIPLESLLEPGNYACYRVRFAGARDHSEQDFPSYVHRSETGIDILWGATYRIVTGFVERVFQFRPPPLQTRPLHHGTLQQRYLHGSR